MSPAPPKSNHPHVAVVAFPFSSHAAQLLAAVRCLAVGPGEGATFSFFSTAESNNSVFRKHKKGSGRDGGDCSNVRAYDVWDGVPQGYSFTGKPQESIELFMEAAPRSLRLSIAAAEAEAGRAVTCLVTDAFFWFAAEMAEEMGVPWVAFWIGGSSSLSAHFYTQLIRHTIIGVTPTPTPTPTTQGSGKEENLSFIPGMTKVVVKDLPEGVVFGNLESLFSEMLHQMGLMLPRAAAVFINSFEELDKTITDDLKSKFNNFLNVGPFSILSSTMSSSPPALDENGCLPWLDKQEAASVVYISFGTIMVPSVEELVAIAEALEGGGVPFIWSISDNAKANLPNGFLDKTKEHGLVVPWAPQAEIMSHRAVGVCVMHCGWNSMLESIAGGVPMICRPFFADHRLNLRTVVDVWEIGVRVEGEVFTKEEFERCLNLVLYKEEGKKMREKIKFLKELATKAVDPRGSSTANFKLLQGIITKSE